MFNYDVYFEFKHPEKGSGKGYRNITSDNDMSKFQIRDWLIENEGFSEVTKIDVSGKVTHENTST